MSRTAAADEAEFRSLMPEIPFTRRGFLVSSLAAGFALATQPVMAQTMIVTPADGLEAGETKIPVHDGELTPQRRPVPRASAVSISVVTSVVKSMPVTAHARGYIEIGVKPGIVLTSLTSIRPSRV
mgnify:CR=1 FL=1